MVELDQEIKPLEVIKELTERFKGPDCAHRALVNYSFQLDPNGGMKLSETLSHGYPGLVVLYSALDAAFPSENWDIITHQYILLIKKQIESEGIHEFSLFGGLTGSCFSILYASKQKRRYQKLLKTLNNHLVVEVRKTLFPRIYEKISLGLPSHMSWLDLMSGITGVGAYLLCDPDDSQNVDLLSQVLSILVQITKDIQVGSHLVPGWYTPQHYQFIESDKKIYPKGNFNMGISHGVSGFLSLMSLASIQGVEVPGQIAAMKKMADWLLSKKREDKQGQSYWSDRIAFEEELGKGETSTYFTADAWCYGSAGVCRSLYLAGKCMDRKDLVQVSHEGFLSILNRSDINWNLHTSSFCHGYSGLLTLFQLMGRDLGCKKIQEAISPIRTKILAGYSSDCLVGFKDMEPNMKNQFVLNKSMESHGPPKMIATEKIGLLDGATGILLALLSTETGDLSWARPFLIEGEKG